ncbi:MAG: hypothetical protein ACKOHK_02040, partial [Planctomycetia bacterium]
MPRSAGQRPNTIAPSGRPASGPPRGANSLATIRSAIGPATPTTARAPRPPGVSSDARAAPAPT